MSTPSLVELHDVTKAYSTTELAGAGGTVLRGVTFSLSGGESMAITGPSGSGKSTLLNIIGLLDEPTSGTVTVAGGHLPGTSEKILAPLRNKAIGFVFQLHHLLPQCTVLENILIPSLVKPRPPAKQVSDRAMDLLLRTGLGDYGNRFPGELSGGERQRVAVVRALINSPQLLLADEPTGSLDSETAAQVLDVILTLQRQEKFGLILVTHAVDIAASLPNHRILKQGRLENAS